MAAAMLDALIGDPEADDDEEGDAPIADTEDPKAKKKRALRALASAMGVKIKDEAAAVDAFADAVDACLEYESPED